MKVNCYSFKTFEVIKVESFGNRDSEEYDVPVIIIKSLNIRRYLSLIHINIPHQMFEFSH